MRAYLRSLSVALTLLLVSTASQAQITGDGDQKPGEPTACPSIRIEPARGMCPGWEASQNCKQTVFTVIIQNTTTCAIPMMRINALPHSQGVNFAVCTPAYGVSRMHCAPDPIHIMLDQKPLMPGEMVELQISADRLGDLELVTMCKENFQPCSVPIHIPMFPSPYPRDPNQPTQPDQPAPTQTIPGPLPTTPSEPTDGTSTDGSIRIYPSQPRSGEQPIRPGGIIEGGDGPEVVPGR